MGSAFFADDPFPFFFAFDWISFRLADADFFVFLVLGQTSKALFGLVDYLPGSVSGRTGFHALYLI
jgi:hypothetical protein